MLKNETEALEILSPFPKDTATERFAGSQALKLSGARKQFLVGGEWVDQLPSGAKPDNLRYVFGNATEKTVTEDSYQAWLDLDAMRAEANGENPVLPEAAFARINRVRTTNGLLTLFVPWGVNTKYQGEGAAAMAVSIPGSAEMRVLQRIKCAQDQLTGNSVPSQVLLMPADLYATEVNNYDQSTVDAYLERLRLMVDMCGFGGIAIKPWSEIRSENRAEYDRVKTVVQERLQNADQNKKLAATMRGLTSSAEKRSGYDKMEEQQAAMQRYVVERLCEAEIIESQYIPIKVSCVGPQKDGVLDGNIPRVYLIPEKDRAPWLDDLERRKS